MSIRSVKFDLQSIFAFGFFLGYLAIGIYASL